MSSYDTYNEDKSKIYVVCRIKLKKTIFSFIFLAMRNGKKQLEFKAIKGWGGKRLGAGRPNLSKTVNHMKREKVTLKTPLHLTLKLKDSLPSLRKKTLLQEFRKSVKLARFQGLYIIHFSIQKNHIHLLAEASNNRALALGMRSLAGRFAKIVRRYAKFLSPLNSKGSVFKGRYHVHVLKTPTEVRNALEYVLLNFSKHQKVIPYLDSFSSASFFKDWQKLLGRRLNSLIMPDARNELHKDPFAGSKLEKVLSPPRSWLADQGWKFAI